MRLRFGSAVKSSDELNNVGRQLTIGNSLLLFFIFALVFLIPLFPNSQHKILYNAAFMIIFFMSVLSLKNRKHMFMVAVIISVVEFASAVFDLVYLLHLSRLLNFAFFIYIVFHLIVQIAQTKIVTAGVILESINGYLLLGVVFSIVISFAASVCPTAFSFPPTKPNVMNFSTYVYFTFVTLSTLGYGDMVPKTPFGQSLATFIAVTGQIYVAVIIAMLVGKFSGQVNKK